MATVPRQISMSTSRAIGIDLGTTYSCVGVFHDGKAEIIANEAGNFSTPSYVAFNDSERLVGEAAKYQTALNPANTIFDVKRLMGRKFDDATIQADMRHWPFAVMNKEGKPVIMVEYRKENRTVTPEQISAMILNRMKETAEAYLGHPVENAVITVPGYFNDAQRIATKNAAAIAGIATLKIMNESSAAALAYAAGRDISDKKFILIFDMGGGTTDVTLMEIKGAEFEVRASIGDTHLGGEDFDLKMLEHCVKLLMLEKGKVPFGPTNSESLSLWDLIGDNAALRRLLAACERAKRQLSDWEQVVVEVGSLYGDAEFTLRLTRAEFEQLCFDHLQQVIALVTRVMSDACIDSSAIDDIVLVGGGTKMAAVQRILSEYFGGKELCTDLDPEEAVARGAALQAAILSGVQHPNLKSLVAHDILPLSLGIATAGGTMTTVMERGTRIPAIARRIFTTHLDDQPAIAIHVYEGERALVSDNRLLGQFALGSIPPAPKGVPQIEVTFLVDANGILAVTARDLMSVVGNALSVKGDQEHLSSEDIDRLVAEAALYEKEDKAAREIAVARSRLMECAYAAKNALENHGTSLSDEERVVAQKAIEECLRHDWNTTAAKIAIEEKERELAATTRRILHKMQLAQQTAQRVALFGCAQQHGEHEGKGLHDGGSEIH